MTGRDFAYADGGEERLAKLFESDQQAEQATASQQPTDWELLYHLSPLRANLIRWVDFGRQEKVEILEVGAGCGAITEYLVSLGDSVRVTAVEGAPARAHNISLRCRNAGNLEVINANIMEYRTDRKHDFVLSIGVLEYGGKYVEGADPYLEYLRHVASFLKEDGQLMVAIENQLGYKYIAGIPEDHCGTPYEGLSNYPHYDGVRTFDKKALGEMLTAAGLPHQRWYFPFPDYKLPTVVLSEDGIREKDFDWLALLRFPSDDPVFRTRPVFAEKEFLRLLMGNVDVSVFMNSFLVVAGRKTWDMPGMLAVKFNTLRAKEHQTTKWFLKTGDNNICVKTICHGTGSGHVDAYLKGYRNLHNELVDALYLNKPERVRECFGVWHRILETRRVKDNRGLAELFETVSRRVFLERIYPEADDWLDPECIDLTPRNILFNDQTKDTRVIDLEWEFECPIPMELVVNRGMHDIANNLNALRGGRLYDDQRYWDFPKSLLQGIPPIFNSSPVDSFSAELVEVWLARVCEGIAPPVRMEDVDSARARYSPVKEPVVTQQEVHRPAHKKVAVALARLVGRSRIARRIAEHVLGE